MLTPNMGNAIPAGSLFAIDTGCFTKTVPFDLPRYLDYLEAAQPLQGCCLFATAPDVVGDAEATWRRSQAVLPLIRALGYRAALVAQDGIEDMAVDWDSFDCLFVGGTTRFKLSETAYGLVAEANRRGKWTHQGRCNSYQRLSRAAGAGYDSADGTFLKFGPDKNLPKVMAWLDGLKRQPEMAL